MHIVHITDSLPSYHFRTGGAEQACYNLIKLFEGTDYRITVITTTPTTKQKNFFAHISIRTLEDYVPSTLSDYILGIKNRAIPLDPLSKLQAKTIFEEIRPDVIQLYKFNALSFSVLDSAFVLNIPLVLTVYDYWYFCPSGFFVDIYGKVCDRSTRDCLRCKSYREFSRLSQLMLKLRNPLVERYMKKINRFVVLSHSSAKVLIECGIPDEKITVIPQVLHFELDNDEKNARHEIEPGSVLFAGWMDSKKGLHIILQAMTEILRKVPDAKLYVLAVPVSFEYQKSILELVNFLRIQKNVEFIGKVPRRNFLTYLEKVNCIVIPEQWENMSPVLLVEAMALGKPVVASHIGGIPEFIEDGLSGFLAEPDNPIDFAEKVIRILTNRELALAMGKSAKQKAAVLFSKEAVSEKLCELYDEIITNKVYHETQTDMERV